MELIDKIPNKKKLFYTTLLILISFLLVFKPVHTNIPFSSIDSKSNEYLNKTITKATITYAGLRTMNAVISVIQSIAINASFKIPFIASGGGSISIGELFDPLNDLIERCSVVVLCSLASLGIQKIIMQISPMIGFQILLPIALILFCVGFWLPYLKGFDFRKNALKILIFAIVIRFCIPVAAFFNERIDTLFLSEKYEQTQSEITELEDTLNNVKTSLTVSRNIKSTLDGLKNTLSNKIQSFIDTIIIFIVQTVLIPVFVLFLLSKVPGIILNNFKFYDEAK
ncbi:MAG: hypothetical protein GY714_19820 [Desulfobacterales bacterium]|nr:hypothetical protein [Desulfobacterales bacterium]